MPNIATLFKSEISRLSRKEVRKEVQPLRKAAAAHHREIAALKRTIAALERRSKQIAKQASSTNRTPVTDEIPARFVAKGLVSLRKRLALSAADFARLLGVSMQSIYNWEHKKATPRKEQIAAIVALRSIGKKEAVSRLERAESNDSAGKRRAGNARPSRKRATRKQRGRPASKRRARGR